MQMQQIQQQQQHRTRRARRGGHTAFVMLTLTVAALVAWVLVPL